MSWISRLALVWAALACCACGAVTAAPQSGFPALGELRPRTPSNGHGRYAADSFQESLPTQNVAVEGSFLDFQPEASGTTLATSAFAFYYLPVDDPASGELDLSLDWWVEPQFGQVYLAVGNQSTRSWEWHRVDSATFGLALNPDDDYVDANDGVLVALVVLPAAGACALSYIDLKSQSGSGWQQTDIASFFGPQSFSSANLGEVALIGGKPAIVYSWNAGEPQGLRLQLAQSLSTDGSSPSDWVIHDLGPLPAVGVVTFGLAEIADGYGITWTYRDNDGNGELHYLYALLPDADLPNSGFSDDTVYANAADSLFWGRLGQIGGKPGITFMSDADGAFNPYYAWAAGAAGGTWTISQVSAEDFTLINPTSNCITVPREIGGAPAFAALNDDGVDTGMHFYLADNATPSLSGDWNTVDLGVASGAVTVDMAELDGKPVLSVNSLYTTPQVCTINQFTGNDILLAGQWTETVLDNIGIGFSSEIQVFNLGGDLAIAAGDAYGPSWDGADFLNAASRPQWLYRGSSIVNDSAQWSREVVLHDTAAGINRQTRFIDLGGQPAFATLLPSAHDDGDTGTETVLRWSVFRPAI